MVWTSYLQTWPGLASRSTPCLTKLESDTRKEAGAGTLNPWPSSQPLRLLRAGAALSPRARLSCPSCGDGKSGVGALGSLGSWS